MKSPKSRSIIFVATADAGFEEAALQAVLQSGHGLRRANDFRGICRTLGEGTGDIALAIIDLDLENRGHFLLQVLGGYDPSFPILAVSSEACTSGTCENVCRMAAARVVKPLTADDLYRKIQETCRDYGAADDPPLLCEVTV